MGIARATPSIAAVLALGVAGCGDDAASRSAFIAKADRVCRAYDTGLARIQQDLNTAAATAQRRRSLTPLVPALARAQALASRTTGAFGRIEAPQGDADEVARLRAGLAAQVTSYARLAGSARQNRIPAFNRANQQVAAGQAKTRAAMRRYGLKDCGRTS